MICSSCGRGLPDGGLRCGACGSAVLRSGGTGVPARSRPRSRSRTGWAGWTVRGRTRGSAVFTVIALAAVAWQLLGSLDEDADAETDGSDVTYDSDYDSDFDSDYDSDYDTGSYGSDDTYGVDTYESATFTTTTS